MKIYVMTDMEGVSGIFHSSQVRPGDALYQEGRRFLTWDVNACVAGCFEGGADEVIVRDAHGGGSHFIWEALDERARYVQGRSALDRMPGLDGASGLILLGYHAMAGTRQAVLEHTMSSAAWQNFFINGRRCGETAVDAALAGERGVPTVMASGDDKLCAEAREFIDGVATAEIKEGLDCQGAVLLPKEVAHARIREAAAKAVGLCGSVRPFTVETPTTLRLEVVSRQALPETRPGVRVIDGRTYEVTADSMAAAMDMLT